MKKNSALLLVIAVFVLAGCQGKPRNEALQNAALRDAALRDAAAKALEIKPGSGKKATVTKIINAGGYTYVEVADDKGEKIWLGLPEMKVADGDKIEYTDTVPMLNFNSKTLNRKFDKILFVSGIRIEKK